MADVAVKNRGYIRGSITKLYRAKNDWHSFSSDIRGTLKLKLGDYNKRLESLNETIQTENIKDENFDFEKELKECEKYQDLVNECLIILKTADSDTQRDFNSRDKLLKNPQLPLPTFSGKNNEDLSKFLFQFQSSVDRYKISDFDKLLLLKQQLSGRALCLIDSLEIVNQNYNSAVSLLEKAFLCKITQTTNFINQLSSIKLNPDDDPYNYVSNIRNLLQNMNKFQLTTEDFFLHFVWKGLNEEFQKQFVLLTNSTRPTLNVFMDNFFKVCDRYTLLNLNAASKKSEIVKDCFDNSDQGTSGFAADVSKPRENTCILCSDSNHTISKCNKYISPSDKLERLKTLNCCMKCTKIGHFSRDYKFRFKNKCYYCASWHFSFV